MLQSVEVSSTLASQHEILLILVCSYYVFLKLLPGIKENDFYKFAHKLVDTSFELAVLQPVDQALCRIVG